MTKRSTATRDRHRTILRRGGAPCHICGEVIDYSLPHLAPGAFVVDHIVPLSRGGTDTLDNKAPAHRSCNGIKAASIEPVKLHRSGSLAR